LVVRESVSQSLLPPVEEEDRIIVHDHSQFATMTTENNESTIPAAESGDAFDHFCTVTEGFMCCGDPGMTTSGSIDLTREKEEDKDALDHTFETIGRGFSRDTTTDANDEMIETKEETPASQKSESQDKVIEGEQEEEDLVDQVFNQVEGACCTQPNFESQDKVTQGQQEEEELLDQVFNNVEGVCCNQPQKDEDEPIMKETEPSKAAEVEVTTNDSKLSTGSKETDAGTGDEPLIKEQTIVTRTKWWQLLCCKTTVVETVVVM
jgi:hypothetical protein